MSQNPKSPIQVSEELFTTQDLLKESEELFNTEDLQESVELVARNTDHDVEMSEDLDAVPDDEEETIAEAEENENLEDIAEDLEMVEDESEAAHNDTEQIDTDTTDNTTGAKTKAIPKVNRISELPLAKIKHIIKLDPEVKLVNAEAVYLITKATEAFIKSLAKESYNFAVQQKKKTVTKPYVDQALTMLPIEM